MYEISFIANKRIKIENLMSFKLPYYVIIAVFIRKFSQFEFKHF